MQQMKTFTVIVALLMVALMVASVYAGPTDDQYLAGYTAAVLDRELQVRGAKVTVQDGVVTIAIPPNTTIEEQRIVEAISGIEGVQRVVVGEAEEAPTSVPTVVETPNPKQSEEAKANAPATSDDTGEFGFNPFRRPRVFQPLLADPRWPHFSASYQGYMDDSELGNVGSVTFGESFSFYRDQLGEEKDSEWEIGAQAAVFSIFDLDAESSDLINADYYGSITGALRLDKFSLLGRLFHQSSHLGDEFLLRNDVDRVNLSYEGVDVILSYFPLKGVRIYGGTAYLLRTDPDDLERWSAQYGIELRSPEAFINNTFRPIAAADFQHREESDWDVDLSLRAGFQLEGPQLSRQTIQILMEYYNGRSPNGQFYTRPIEYMGVGLHVYF